MAVSIHGNNGVVTTNGTAAAPSFAAPDTDTGLYFGTNLIHATTNGVNRFNIDANGNVGIGTTAPAVKLNLVGDRFQVDNTGNPFMGTRFNAGADGAVLFLQHSRSGTIGTKLTLNDNDEIGAIQFRAYASDNTNIKHAASIKAEVNGTPTANGVPADLIFNTGTTSANATEKVRILSSGQMIIGTTQGHADADDLTIATSGRTGMTIRSASNDYGNIFFSDATSGTGQHQGIFQYYHADDAFIWKSGSSTTERLYIKSDGKIGINTTSPDAMLQVDYDFANSAVGLRLRAASGSGTKTWQLSEINGTPAVLTIRNATNGYNILNIDGANQRVGINKTDPDGKGIDVAHGRTNTYSGTSDHRGLAHIIARNTSDAPDRFASISLVSGGSTQAEASINLVQTANYTGDLTFKTRYAATSWAERLRITSSGDVSISSSGTVYGVSKLTILPADRTTAFNAADGDTWHDVVIKQTGSATNNAVGIAFELFNNVGYHKNAGTGIAAVKNGTNSDYGSDLVFITRGQSTPATEKYRIKDTGQVQFPVNGQEVCWGHTQQFRMSWDQGEQRQYLTGSGAYGVVFRINGGNRIEIDKTTGDVTMQGASGRNFQWDNSEPSLYLTDNGSNSARLKIGSGGDLQMYHDVSPHTNHITCATNGHLKISTNTLQVYEYSGVTKKFEVTNRGKYIGYHADTSSYGASNWARTGSGNQSNSSQACPEGSMQWQSDTSRGVEKYKSYIQTTTANQSGLYITVQNASFYRITAKASHNSTQCDVAMWLVYGMNSAANAANRITQIVNSGGFSCSNHNTHVNSHDSTIKIDYSASVNQGVKVLVEQIGGF